MNSQFIENLKREALNPTFGKKYEEVIPATLIWNILSKLLLRIFTIYAKQNDE